MDKLADMFEQEQEVCGVYLYICHILRNLPSDNQWCKFGESYQIYTRMNQHHYNKLYNCRPHQDNYVICWRCDNENQRKTWEDQLKQELEDRNIHCINSETTRKIESILFEDIPILFELMENIISQSPPSRRISSQQTSRQRTSGSIATRTRSQTKIVHRLRNRPVIVS